MPNIGPRCYELRVRDRSHNWRIVYRLDSDAIFIVEVFAKATRQTPRAIIDTCQRRLRQYDQARRPRKS
jgi:phage-related protein